MTEDEHKAAIDQQWAHDCVRWRGRVLTGRFAHYCSDWDGLPVDETTEELTCCGCYPDTEELRQATAAVQAKFTEGYYRWLISTMGDPPYTGSGLEGF